MATPISSSLACRQCGGGFSVYEDDLVFYQRFGVPAPSLCFECRFQRRLAFYNRRSLYRRACDFTKKPIVSMYSPDKPFLVYDKDVWQSDQWNPLDYGRDFDFSRPFFPQFRELLEAVPMQSLNILGQNVNSDFTNDNLRMKDCYLVFDCEEANGVMYAETLYAIKDSMDLLGCSHMELCYECTLCENCYALKFSRYCNNCQNSWFLSDCIGCRDCFGCINLRQKEHHIYNQPVSKEQYQGFIAAFRSGSRSELDARRREAEELFISQPQRAQRGVRSINVSGAFLTNCKNAFYCFSCRELEDGRYCTDMLLPAKSCMDVHIWGKGVELAYNSAVIGVNCFNVLCSYYVASGCRDIAYCFNCTKGCADLFGCSALQKARHCILNKPYSPSEYRKLRERIAAHMKESGEWGEFFPPEISPFGYNETLAAQYFPLAKEEVLARGWPWSDYEAPLSAARTLTAADLPDDSRDLDETIGSAAIVCEITGRPFRFTAHELQFYQDQRLPLPRRHPDQRHLERFCYKAPYRLWQRRCGRCDAELLCNYPPAHPAVLYCEDCYNAEMF
jgi:hypothetical protein